MEPKFIPLQLGDIFEKIFKLTGKTFVRSLILVCIILLPAAVLLAFGFDSLFSNIIAFIEEMEYYDEPSLQSILEMFTGFFSYGIAITIFVLGTLICTLAVTIIGCHETMNEQISWQEAFKETFSMKFWKLLGASILQSLAIFGIFILPYIIMIVGLASSTAVLAVFGILFFLAAMVGVIYLSIRWVFIITAIAYENTGVIEAFSRSGFLVKNYFWRTLGIVFLLHIIAQFAISVVTTPVSVAVFWDIFVKIFSLISENYNPDPKDILQIFSSLGYRMAIITAVSTIAQLLITPLITVILYFDLRARKNEFDIPIEDSSNLA